jgi:uncharacterized protein
VSRSSEPPTHLFTARSNRTAARRPPAPVPDDARPYAVRMRDGVRLATDVYLPSPRGRWPVLLSRLPYDKAGDECFMPSIARWFTERGYAVVVQDVRGKVRSGGALAPFVSEAADGYDTIDWIAQQPWCDGPVGMFGDSYFGWTQWAAAASRHPALRAITPRVISADVGDITARQGVFALEVTALWALETWVDEGLYDYETGFDWAIRPLSEVVPTALGGRRSPFLDQVAAGGIPAPARAPIFGDIPALHLGGWWDLARRGQIATWHEASRQQRAPQFLLMDAADHGWTHVREPGQPYVDPRTDASTMARYLDCYLGPLAPFLRHFLTGEGDYQAPPVRWMLTHDGWQTSDSWPPEGSRPLDWFLQPRQNAAGALAGAPARRERVVSWRHDPKRPVPSLAHAYHPLIQPPDESALDGREDVLIYETQPQPAPLDLAGPVSVSVHLSSSAPSTHLMATVSDLPPTGPALRVLDGAAHAAGPWPQKITIDLGSTGYRLRPGHRLRLALSSSEFPRYPPHPGTAADPWSTTDFRPAENRIVVGGVRGAYLRCFAVATRGEDT